jgi:hypothetical protein
MWPFHAYGSRTISISDVDFSKLSFIWDIAPHSLESFTFRKNVLPPYSGWKSIQQTQATSYVNLTALRPEQHSPHVHHSEDLKSNMLRLPLGPSIVGCVQCCRRFGGTYCLHLHGLSGKLMLASPTRSFLVPSIAGLMTLFYRLKTLRVVVPDSSGYRVRALVNI